MLGQMKSLYDTAVENLSQDNLTAAKDAAKEGATSLLDSARNHPKTTAAIVLGAGLAAAALWVLREPQRLRALKRNVSGYLGTGTQQRRRSGSRSQ